MQTPEVGWYSDDIEVDGTETPGRKGKRETMATTEHCDYCKIEAKRAAGQELTREERNEWMWGCMCEPGSAAAANSFMDLISR